MSLRRVEQTVMKKIRYVVAMSLDGYIADPHGEADWIVSDPDVNFVELWSQFDTFLMGRRTYEPVLSRLGKGAIQGKKAVVASRTLRPEDHPDITVIAEVTSDFLRRLRAQSKKDIWLFGGGELFRTLLEMRQVDTVEVSIMPVVLGGGISLLPSPAGQAQLKLTQHKVYRSGIVSLIYEVQN
jgi:dihydrofolate reductase